jgi:N-methylhydantoinase A
VRVGIEVGGTFTDLIALDRGEVRIAKVPSVPRSPEEGVFAALEAAGIPLDRVADLVHGSTVATNTVLERKGALTALIVTRGFRDILLLQRQDRPKVYQLVYQKPAAVVERRDTLEVDERTLATGEIARALNPEAVARSVSEFLARRPYRAVAICLLNAYANAAHEHAVAAVVRALFPNLYVSCSADISREFREYERASTTALSAYVQPIIDSYLGRFEERLAASGFRGRFSIMQSNGGRLPVAAIRRNAITALFSGPAGGVTGAVRQAGLGGFRNLITFDMGGTSTDVCLVSDGSPVIAPETAIDGLPVRTPVIDIASVGAGGGSIIWRDDGGMLQCGPRSSGADPGPACYGRGGTQPTITDAHVICGTIQPDRFLGGRMKIDAEAAGTAFATLAGQFAMSLPQIADSAIRVANAAVVRAIQLISTELGRDPRDYVLVPFGGAGPLHAGAIAADLGIGTIVVPPHAGVLSAYGLLAADFAQFETRTHKVPADDHAGDAIRALIAEMRAALTARFRSFGIAADLVFSTSLQMRFVGQAFELDVPIADSAIAALDAQALREAFAIVHHQVYFHAGGGGLASKRIEVVGFRIGASAPEVAFNLPLALASGVAPHERKQVFADKEAHNCWVVSRPQIDAGAGLAGPALIEDTTSTIFVPVGWHASHDGAGNLVISRTGG